MNEIDWIGYAATVFIVISFLVGNDVRVMRIINMIGAFLFIIYGFLLDKNLPIILPNTFIACIHIYYLFIRKSKSKNGHGSK
jgi:hypothetical protein